jgi:hypothetical protein
MSNNLEAAQATRQSWIQQLIDRVRADVGTVPPRSAIIASVLAGGGILWIGGTNGLPTVTIISLLTGLAIASGIAGVGQPHATTILVSGTVLLAASGIGGGLVAFNSITRGGWHGVFVGSSLLVGFGVGRYRINSFGEGAVSQAIAWLLRLAVISGTLALIVGALLIDIPRAVVELASISPLPPITTPESSDGLLVGFLIAVWSGGLSVVVFVATLPPATVFTPARRSAYETIQRVAVYVGGGVLGVGSVVVAFIYNVAGGADSVVGMLTQSVVVSIPLRIGLLRLSAVCVAGIVLFQAIRVGGQQIVGQRSEWLLSGAVIGSVLVFLSGISASTALPLAATISNFPVAGTAATVIGTPSVILAGATGGLSGLAALLTILPFLNGIGLFPTRVAAARMTLLGGMVAVGSGSMLESSAVVSLAVTVIMIVAWDIAEQGHEITTTIGERPAQRSGEFTHIVGSLLMGIVSCVVVGSLYWSTSLLNVTVDDRIGSVIVGLFLFFILILKIR